ncbi:hypothetical protein MK805_17195 [Shimazuella sp. AN120528]|uniref:hypothetical protein n=1 Tax=Shimazuella soli TaxID=1892854 RepID=UPI001F0E7D49|nr:hypothetical protein [Shimazuella soli]MCH5586674.1 hypothetical protein [Shimazuella soli]
MPSEAAFQQKKEDNEFIYGLTPIVYLITFVPKNINDFFHFATFENNIIVLFVLIVPSILLIISSFNGKRNARMSN